MKKDKTAKHLAEEHFFFKKPLTLEEEKILENSKYSRLINKSYKKTVDSIIENVTEGKPLKKEEIVPTKKRKRGIHIGLNKEELRELALQLILDRLPIIPNIWFTLPSYVFTYPTNAFADPFVNLAKFHLLGTSGNMVVLAQYPPPAPPAPA